MENVYVFDQHLTEDGRRKLKCAIGTRVTVGVNVFTANGQTYVRHCYMTSLHNSP